MHNNNSASNFELIIGDTDIQDWVQANRQFVVDKFRQHGAILFRGFKGGLDNFLAFTDLFCKGYMYSLGRTAYARRDISFNHKVQTVDRGGGYFPLHPERSQTPFQPDIAFFHCRQAPQRGGETTFCDGALLLSIFPEEIRNELAAKRFRFLAIQSEEQLQSLLGIADPNLLEDTLAARSLDNIYTMKAGRIIMDFTKPVLNESKFSKKLSFANFLLFGRFLQKHRNFPTYEDGSEIPDSLCVEIDKLARQITTLVRWQNDDILMLDNTRVMHGRNPVDPGTDRDIWTRFGYANFE